MLSPNVSDYYEEVSLLLGQELKLSCFYDKIPYEKGVHANSKRTYVAWLLLDKLLPSYGERYTACALKIRQCARTPFITVLDLCEAMIFLT